MSTLILTNGRCIISKIKLYKLKIYNETSHRIASFLDTSNY